MTIQLYNFITILLMPKHTTYSTQITTWHRCCKHSM